MDWKRNDTRERSLIDGDDHHVLVCLDFQYVTIVAVDQAPLTGVIPLPIHDTYVIILIVTTMYLLFIND